MKTSAELQEVSYFGHSKFMRRCYTKLERVAESGEFDGEVMCDVVGGTVT